MRKTLRPKRLEDSLSLGGFRGERVWSSVPEGGWRVFASTTNREHKPGRWSALTRECEHTGEEGGREGERGERILECQLSSVLPRDGEEESHRQILLHQPRLQGHCVCDAFKGLLPPKRDHLPSAVSPWANTFIFSGLEISRFGFPSCLNWIRKEKEGHYYLNYCMARIGLGVKWPFNSLKKQQKPPTVSVFLSLATLWLRWRYNNHLVCVPEGPLQLAPVLLHTGLFVSGWSRFPGSTRSDTQRHMPPWFGLHSLPSLGAV